MSGRQLTRAEAAARREAGGAARQARWTEVEEPKFKAAVRAEVERRGLASFMNRTRWEALRDAVCTDLPFPPAFQLQPVMGEREPLMDPDEVFGWGGWNELEPSFAIEWLRVVPRYRKPVGQLVADEVVDCTDAFRDLLGRLRVPYREDGAATFWIYGYAAADPSTLTSPPEMPT